MTVNSITSSTPASTTAVPQNQLQGTEDEFLKMFMAQLQNQDPMNPSSGSDMVAQLATFSQVEQATQTNTDLTALTAQATSSANAGMANLVGRQATASASSFQITSTGGSPPALVVSSTSAMSGATAQVTDANGNVIRSIPIPDGGTSATINWDGKDSNGVAVPPGSYSITVTSGKSNAAITAQWSGMINSIAMTPSGAQLQMGDVLVSPGAISTIGTTTTTPTLASALSQTAAVSAFLSQGASS
jgi:flagellar basal-body rod modification protein FlgD